MQKRTLGNSLGSFGSRARLHGSEFWLRPSGDEQEMISLLRAVVECGITFFDNPQVYGPFTNEELVGETFSPFRGQVVIATKVGFKLDPTGKSGLGWT